MSVLRVTCITRDESDSQIAIRALGGKGFYHTVDEAIASINSRTHQYWAELNGESVWLEVAHDDEGIPYLTTENDQMDATSLLGLQDCEASAEEASAAVDASSGAVAVSEVAPQSVAADAERLAIRIVLRILVLSRYGRDEARLNRNRQHAIQRASAEIQTMGLDGESKKQLQEAVTRELSALMAPAPQR